MKAETHSSTALMIARSTYVSSFEPNLAPLLPRDAVTVSNWFVTDHAKDATQLRKRWYRSILQLLQAWVLPGVQLHYLLRKRVIETGVRAAIEGGAKQVVVIAGGFDTLAYRLHAEFPDVRFFELDHPATQRSKRSSLDLHGVVNSNLTLHPVDLTKRSLAEVLPEVNIDATTETVVLAEGLLMYLDPAQVEQLLQVVAEHFRSPLHVAVSFMVPDPRGRLRFHNASWMLGAWLAWKRERFVSAFTHQQFAALLERAGFAGHEFWDQPRMRHDYLPTSLQSEVLAEGEHLVFTTRTTPR